MAVHVVVEDVARIKHERWVCPAHLRKAKLQGEEPKCVSGWMLNETFYISQIASDVNLKRRGDLKGRS